MRAISRSETIARMTQEQTQSDDLKVLYSELGQAWRVFVAWREKIFAGYVTALAALGVAFHLSPQDQWAIFLAAAVLSLVCWILDVRNQHFMNACQTAGESLERALILHPPGEKQGCYSAINQVRVPKSALSPV